MRFFFLGLSRRLYELVFCARAVLKSFSTTVGFKGSFCDSTLLLVFTLRRFDSESFRCCCESFPGCCRPSGVYPTSCGAGASTTSVERFSPVMGVGAEPLAFLWLSVVSCDAFPPVRFCSMLPVVLPTGQITHIDNAHTKSKLLLWSFQAARPAGM